MQVPEHAASRGDAPVGLALARGTTLDERVLRESEAHFRALAENAPFVFWVVDLPSRCHVYVSPGYARVWGRPLAELEADPASWRRALHPDDRERVLNAMREAPTDGYDLEYRIVWPDQSVRWVRDRAFSVRDAGGRPIRLAGICEDVTRRRAAEDDLVRLAHYDVLTGLPNRVLFQDRVAQEIARARRNGGGAALMFIDLDRFKVINDTLGHDVGDELLKQVARRLTGSLRASDTVSRFGGDEFAVLMTELRDSQAAGHVADKVISAFAQPFLLGGQETYVTASIGIALYPVDGDLPATLVKHADIAMYRAKELNRNNVQFYTPKNNARAIERLRLENDLRKALEREQFVLYFQPKVDLATRHVCGAEALLRWRHPERGLVSPAEFIPLLEETGMIVPVGEWILRAACRQIKEWDAQGLPPLRVAVNLSGRQFHMNDLPDMVRRVLAESGVEPQLLELEITESFLMRNADEAIGALRELKAEGVHLAVDDFGTGYSSLAYLKRFPLDTLKIDRSFVRDITTDPDDAAITRTVINMARGLKLSTVAEGVETEAQLAFLTANGCDHMQGYFYSPPVPAEECAKLVRERRALVRAAVDTPPAPACC
ncbi:MAG: EAL domain-containing protein [Burkholderiales bacterium]|nr:EAL domain-containing protein [Burkholderiales bacterium]